MRVRSLSPSAKGALAVTIVFLFKPWVHGFDTVGYYSWLRSAVVDGDLEVGDEFAYYGFGGERGLTPTGHTHNEFAVGSAVLWSPLYVLAHGFTLAARAAGWPLAADGYAPQYVWAASLGSAGWALAALLLTYRLGCRLFSPRVAALATLAVWLASPLVFYTFSHPLMSHANDAFAYALLVTDWQRTRANSAWRAAAARGAAAGLCALVRLQNAVFLIPLFAGILAQGVARRSGRWLAVSLGALLVGWGLAFSPQLAVWRVVFGRWIVLNPYDTGGGPTFTWLCPHILEVLFSTNRGLFVWTPLILPALSGLVPLARCDRRLAGLLGLNFVLQLYVVASWRWWGGSASFGQRFFSNMLPAFGLGLGAWLERLSRARVRFGWCVATCVLFVVWNGLLVVRYALGDVPRIGPMALGTLIGGQFTILPRQFERVVQALLTRR